MLPPELGAEDVGGETTGRYIVVFREDAVKEGVSSLRSATGVALASAADFGETTTLDADVTDVVMPSLGVAVTSMDPDQTRSLLASVEDAGPSAILVVEPERIQYALGMVMGGGGPTDVGTGIGGAGLGRRGDRSPEAIRAYREAVNDFANFLLGDEGGGEGAAEAIAAAFNESQSTWGLQATGADRSQFSGAGVRVAVLDTGFGPQPAADFAGRAITKRSFISGQTADDGHGHGTHCTGTACGPRAPNPRPRYGVAHQSAIFHGKVLSNQGSGADAGIIAGIEWAVNNGCQVISMSLGSRVAVGQPFRPDYEIIAQRALARGSLIIAAAGNDSQRPGFISPVSSPANCPSIMAVAAVDSNMRVAFFSCGARNPNGAVDIAGPGVNVLSAAPRPPFRARMMGTSMAAPHVAGCAALWSQRTGERGRALWQRLVGSARRLQLPVTDVGAGLVQAP
jgi:subtilisin family serine protease